MLLYNCWMKKHEVAVLLLCVWGSRFITEPYSKIFGPVTLHRRTAGHYRLCSVLLFLLINIHLVDFSQSEKQKHWLWAHNTRIKRNKFNRHTRQRTGSNTHTHKHTCFLAGFLFNFSAVHDFVTSGESNCWFHSNISFLSVHREKTDSHTLTVK